MKQINAHIIFSNLKAIRYFGESIYDGKIAISKANDKGSNLINNIQELHNKNTEKSKADKEKNSSTYKRVNNIYEGSELTLNALKIRIFSLKSTQGKGTKILTLKQMLQRFNPQCLLAGHACKNVLNNICQFIDFLHCAKETTKKVYNNIMNSIKL